MAWFRRRHTPDRFVLLDCLEAPAEPPPSLRRIAAEAVILQDEAEDVLRGVRDRRSLGELAPRGGPVVRRFFALRDSLPVRCEDPEDERIRRILDVTLHHHAMVLSTALEFLALEWRSDRISRQLDCFDGLGEPARALDEVYAALSRR